MIKTFIISAILLFSGIHIANASILISIFPQKEVIQGDPLMVQISGVKLSNINKLTFSGTTLSIFNYKEKPTAFIGIDLNKKVGDYDLVLTLKNGSTTKEIIKVVERAQIKEDMPIPETSGGNSPKNQTKFVGTLANDGTALLKIKTGLKSYWTKNFTYPVSNPIITDTYGYSRLTGLYSIAHKGTDFKAKVGTRVLSMNRGIVRIARRFETYGNTVVVDHGLGILTFYMHLSKIKVNVGELVELGQLVGLSGSTGYATGPHLHITIRINNISIDPMKFLGLFN